MGPSTATPSCGMAAMIVTIAAMMITQGESHDRALRHGAGFGHMQHRNGLSAERRMLMLRTCTRSCTNACIALASLADTHATRTALVYAHISGHARTLTQDCPVSSSCTARCGLVAWSPRGRGRHAQIMCPATVLCPALRLSCVLCTTPVLFPGLVTPPTSLLCQSLHVLPAADIHQLHRLL